MGNHFLDHSPRRGLSPMQAGIISFLACSALLIVAAVFSSSIKATIYSWLPPPTFHGSANN